MSKRPVRRILFAALLCLGVAGIAQADDFENGWKAYNRQDYAAAYDIWRRLADRNDAQAQLMVGLLYANGQGVGQNVAEAYKWFLISAANGNEHAESLYAGATNLDNLITPEEKAEAERQAQAWRPIEGE
jgi:TPR repeat protein